MLVVAAEGLLAALEWNWTMVDSALDGLDDTLLARCPAAAALGQMTWDNIAHGGQIAYIRGLLTGMGWYTR